MDTASEQHRPRPVYLTELDVAERLGMSRRAIQNWRFNRTGGPNFYKFGKTVRYLLADVEAYEASRRVEVVRR